MAEVKGAGRINIKGTTVMVVFSFTGHVPTPDMEGWLSQKLQLWIRIALTKERDLAATAQDPSSLAQAVMQKHAAELMEHGIVGALTVDGIKFPGGGPPPPAEPEYPFESSTSVRGPDGGFAKVAVRCVFKGELAEKWRDFVEAETMANLMMVVHPTDPGSTNLGEASQRLNESLEPELAKMGIKGRVELLSVQPENAAPAPAAAPTPQLTPEQYGSLCAERELYPGHVAQINAKYGIADPGAAAALDQQWQSQLQSDPTMQQRYQQSYWQYKAWLQSQQQQ